MKDLTNFDVITYVSQVCRLAIRNAKSGDILTYDYITKRQERLLGRIELESDPQFAMELCIGSLERMNDTIKTATNW